MMHATWYWATTQHHTSTSTTREPNSKQWSVQSLVTGQLEEWTTRGLDDSWTGHLVDWTTRGLDISWTRHLVDWTTRGLDISRTDQLADATGDFACLVFISWRHLRDCELSSPRVSVSASCPVTQSLTISTSLPPSSLLRPAHNQAVSCHSQPGCGRSKSFLTCITVLQ